MKRLIPLFAVLATGCGEANYEAFNQFAQGTTYTIIVKNPPAGIVEKIDATFAEIDLTFSVFNPASLASRINRNETDVTTPLFEECFTLAKEVHAATEGYFDPTVGPLVDAWGFGREGLAQEIPCVDCLMEYVGLDKVRLEGGHIIKDNPRVEMNFSSIAKGFTVDLLAEMLEGEGVDSYMVEVGGEVRVKGRNEKAGREWRIQIDKPVFGLERERETVVSFSRELRAIATSGNYRNWFVDERGRTRTHTIDPKTGMPVLGEILSVSIVAAECAVADAWATGIMASGTLDNARRLRESAPPGIEYYIIYGTADSMASIHSRGFPLVK